MEHIIKNLREENWNTIKKNIKRREIDWDYLVDQTNGVLHYLAYHKQFKLIKMIDPNTLKEIVMLPNIEGDTLCHIAAKMNDIDLLSLSISYDPRVIYERNRLLCTPFYYLVGDHNLLKQIIKLVGIEDHYLNNEYTLLEYYILDKNINMVKFLLKHIRITNASNQSIFTTISSENSVDDKIKLLDILIKNGIDINATNEIYLSPLILAIYLNVDYELLEYLINLGADINYSGFENKNNPLIIAVKTQNIPIIELLLEHGTDVNMRDKYLRTPLHYIFFSKKNIIPPEVKNLLLEKCKNINSVDNNMDSIFNLIMQNDDWKKYQNILENKKLKIYLKNKNGIMPIDMVNDIDMEQFLKMVYHSYINQLNNSSEWVDKVDAKISSALKNGDDILLYKKYIIEKIISGTSYPIKKKDGQLIKFIVPPETNITHYSAYSYNYICFLYYIINKYSSIKVPLLAPGQMKDKTTKDLYNEMIKEYNSGDEDDSTIKSLIKDYINHYPALINHLIIWINDKKYFISPYIIPGIKQTMNKFPDAQFILFKLTIFAEQNFNHANVLIFDTKNNYIERFDPYGKINIFNGESIDKTLLNFFVKYFPDTKYLSPSDSSPMGISFQIFSDESNQRNYVENDPVGFCIPWCLWYVEMRAKNKKIAPKSLIERALYQINKKEDKIKDYIRNYSNYLDTEKNKILEGANIPKKYWYSTGMPYKYYKSYLKYVRKIYRSVL